MEEKQKISRAGVGYIIGNYLIRGIGFLAIPIFSRILAASDYGIYNTYVSYESILFIIIGVALHTSFKKAKINFNDKFDDYVSSCVLILVINTIVFIVGFNVVCRILGIDMYGYLTILTLHSFSTAIIAYYNTYLSIYYQSRSYVKISLFNAIGNVAISIFLILTVFSNNRGLGRIIGNFIPCFICGIVIVSYFWKKSRPKYKREFWQYALKYSLPLVPHGISQCLLGSFDRIMIQSMIGASQTGIYSFACNLSGIVSVVYSSLEQVWSSWFYEKMKQNETEKIRKAASKYIFGITLFTIGMMLVSPEIVYFLGTSEYHDAVYILVPSILGVFFAFLYNFPAIIEYFYEKTKYIMYGTILSAIVNIVLNFICIKHFGYRAAAYTTLITYIVYFIVHYMLSVYINKGHLYSIGTFIYSAALLVILGCVTQILIEHMWIRWVLGIIDALVLAYFMNHELNLISFFKYKRQN